MTADWHYDGSRCIGCLDALKWVKALDVSDTETQERVLNRMAYEFDKDIAIKPRFNKGKYGEQYDSYSCGKCGSGGVEAWWTYCPNCGYMIGHDWKDGVQKGIQEKTREEFEQLTLQFDVEE